MGINLALHASHSELHAPIPSPLQATKIDQSLSAFWPNPADRVIVPGTPHNHPSNSAGLGLHRIDSLVMCRLLKKSLSTTNDFGESGTERSRAHNAHSVARHRMREDYRGSVLLQGFLHDLTGVNRRSVDRALEHLLVADQTIAPIQEDHGEDFSLERSEFEAQVIASCLWAR
jgi:hypothetical protein